MRKIQSLEIQDSAHFAALCGEMLRRGINVRFRAIGESMRPNISHGDTVLIAPATSAEVQCGDVVLTHHDQRLTLHRVVSFESSGEKITTRGDSGQQNDPATRNVLGKLVAIHASEKEIAVTRATPYRHALRAFLHRLKLAAARRFASNGSSLLILAVLAGFGLFFGASPATAQTDLAVTADTAAPTPLAPGSQITYSVTVTNNGPRTANSPVVTMNTPVTGAFSTTFVSAAKTGGGGTWTLTSPAVGGTGAIKFTRTTNMGSGSTTTFSFVVQVPAATTNGTVFTNSVNISSTTPDPIPANNTATASATVQAPDISMTQTAAPDPVAPGGTVTYTETVTNNSGTIDSNGATLTQNTPANTTFVSATPPAGWTCGTVPAVGATGAIICTSNTAFPAGTTASNFTIVVSVNSAVANGTIITNSATLSESGTDPVPANNTTSTSVTVQTPDLSMTQTAAPNPVATGANITYTETVTNNSATIDSNGATLTQNTPANTTFVSATPPAGWTCGTVPAVGATGAIICTSDTPFAAATTAGNFVIVVAVNAGAPGGSTITNTATVSETGTDPNLANNTTTTSVLVISADLSLTQTASATAVAPGGTITYTETVTNNGPNTAVGVTLYQQTPPNTVFASMTPPAGWTCGTTPAVGATGQVICTANANVNSGVTSGNFSFVVTVNVGTAAGTTILNWADVTSQTTDPVASNNAKTTSVLVEITGDADLSLSSTASPTPVFIASPITYSIQLRNLGLAAANAVVVTDTYPATLVNPSATTTQGSCAPPSGGTIVCTIGTVAYPLATPITITLTGSTPSTATTLTNTAVVTTTSTDPVAANNTSKVLTVVQPLVCATPGKDGAPGAPLSGIVNTYYAGVGTPAAGSTSLTVTTPSSGSATQIGVGDMLLVIQTQGAQINATNTSSYGDGIAGDPASGSTNLGNSGQFEFVTVTAVTIGAGTNTLTVLGTGANTGLLNSYASVAASNVSVPPQGIQTFQVIRVPQYSSATLSSSLAAFPWNGAVGGVLVLDVASQLTLGGSISLDGQGFRGGGGRILAGGAGAVTDVVTLSTVNTNASKGEGIAGTPHYIAPPLATITLSTTAVSTGQAYLEGYPNGSFARGAPGNAGGGATDANPAANDQNSGGGAGANGGDGGAGGFGWSSAGLVGGFGGIAFPASTSAVIMGGGAGAGTTNNGTSWDPISNSGPPNNCGANCTGIYSSGTAGGGIVIIHAGAVTGTGTITASGQNALDTQNDGGGGGGAGGSILVLANTGTLAGLTATAVGGNGGNTWPEDPPGATFPGNRHGPGGGGGGGVIFTSSTPGSATVAGGAPGTTTLANDAYGATVGQPGVTANVVTITQTPGTQSGAYCAGADLSVTNSGTPNPVNAGGTISYTQTVANAGPLDALNAVFSEAIPANTTFSSITAPAGWTCNSSASILSTGLISCTNPDVPSGVSGTGIFTVNVTVNPATTVGTQIVDVASITSGTSDPNLSNNSATATNIVGSATSEYLTLSKTAASNTVIAGNNITYTLVIKNNGPASSSASVFDTVPTNTTFVSMTAPAGWGCTLPPVGGTGNLSCTTASFANGASATLTLVVNVNLGTPNGTTITNTANANGGLPNPNPNAATATSSVLVASATQADLAVTTSASPNPVLIGNNITYAQTVTNNGPAAAVNLTFTDVIPTGTTFVSLPTPPPGWSCTTPAVGSAGTVTCTIASLASGGTASFPLVVKVASTTTAGTTISNSPTIAATTSDPNAANNTATSTTIVVSPTQADVTITKTAAPEPVDQGTNLTYTIQVVNKGPAVATGISVSDPLPAQVTFTSVSTSQGTCTQAGGTVNCTIGTLSVGGTALININVNATTFSSAAVNCPPPSGPQFNACNTATLTTTSSNPNPAPVTASAGSTIQSSTAVQLSSFQALARSLGGVVLEWHTREEIRNLGFNIYREDAQGRQKVNPSLIAGGALFVRGGRPQHAAKTYQWLDAAGSPAASYWLEDVDLNGTRTTHGPVRAEALIASGPVAASLARPVNAMLLTHLNSSVAEPARPPGVRPAMPRPILPIPGPREYRASLEGMPAVKIAVSHEGWYRVSGAQLLAAGLDSDANVRDLQLYAEGFEQPLLMRGPQTGRIRSSDTIEFYGTGIDTPYSSERIYWLVENPRPGTRISSVPTVASGSSEPQSFSFTTVHEDRTTYFATLLNGEDKDNFFGAAVTSQPVDQDLTIANSDPTSGIPITVDVVLQGGTDLQNHRVSVQFNGASIGEMDFYGLANVTNTFPIDPSLLHDGIGIVTLTALEGDNDVSLVQSIALHYPHRYVADSNWLRTTAPAGSAVHLSGFTSPQIRVFDITNPLSIVELGGAVAREETVYGVTLSTSNPGAAERTLLAFTDDEVSAPDALTHHHPSALAQHPRAADIVIITHPDFEAGLLPLAKLHESEGHEVSVVTVNAIFDAFNFGERSPYAIRSYLQSLSTNSFRKPQAVLFVGDASLDPRNYLGFGDFDFVPTRIIETQALKTASDDWFTDFQQTGFATIATGRLPVRTRADAELVISKIVGYEKGLAAGSWNQQALMISDQNDGTNFTLESQYAISDLPSALKPARIVADSLDPATAHQQILAALNNGALLVNYSGHGATEQWSFSNLFNNMDAAALTNGQRLPFFLLMDCLNGFFQDVYSQSLAESLMLAPNGGAVAVWASSGFTTAPPQASMNQALLHVLQTNPSSTIGAAALQSKLSVNDRDVRRTWILFGDPAMKLQLSTQHHSPPSPRPPVRSGSGPKKICPRCAIQNAPSDE